MSYLEQVEANLQAAIVEQQAGRMTREECVEAMKDALMKNTGSWHSAMDAALDAAIASGYVVVNK
jgi:hypothetical protein